MDDIHDVLNIGSRSAHRTNDGDSVTAATKGVAEHDVICWAAKRQAIIIVIDNVVLK